MSIELPAINEYIKRASNFQSEEDNVDDWMIAEEG